MADSSSSPRPTETPNHQTLSATYQSPISSSFTHKSYIPTPLSTKPADRVNYLSALRKETSKLQEQINKDLTERMEQDKLREGVEKAKGANSVDEAKEEDNYGEEVVEED